MYRSDKIFMKNPATAPCRIYIGNLNEAVLPDNLEERFRAHGKILGLSLQRGFAFIQYENEQQAQMSIRNENGTMFHNRKLNVKPANTDVKPPYNKPGGPMNQQQPFNNNMNQQQQGNNMNQPGNNMNQGNNGPPDQIHNKPPMNQQNMGIMPPQNMGNKPPSLVQMPPFHNPDDINNRKRGRMPHKNFNMNDQGNYGGHNMGPNMGPAGFHRPIDRPDRNDCEIIVVSKLLTNFAEYIEQRLKSLGLVVDLLYPNEDIPIGRVLANISSRGCLFAILVMPQNEENRSLTLNILHGIPQEHRNMPIEDSMILITRNFDAYMRGEKLGTDAPDTDKMKLTDRHPEQIQMIFNLLTENRQLAVGQYDRVLKYLEERRELQQQFELAEGIEGDLIEPEVKSKRAELQTRIMHILNSKPAETSTPKSEDSSVASIPITQQTTTAPPLLNDPTVQKALDSILMGDMFKNIANSL